MRPKRTDDKYWIGTRDFNHIRYERDLEDYIIDLENEVQQLRQTDVTNRRELLIDFLDDVLMCQDEGATIVDREKYVDGYLGN